jgi:hypothetical protein
MKHIFSLLLLLVTAPVYAEETLNEHLLVLAPFIGTWKAEVAENTYDVSHYDWILGGKALRIMHSINDGAYGGEALVHWSEEKQAITFHYVTTSTFYTEGTISPTETGFEAHEVVHGNMDGIVETRSGYEMKDGEIHVWSQLLKNGEWTEKETAIYAKAADAEVRF